MAITDDTVAMDHNVLLQKDYDDHDILSEFLDQRVFDSLNANTPDGPAPAPNANEHLDLFHSDVLSQLKAEGHPLLLDDDAADHDLHVDSRSSGSPNDSHYVKTEQSDYLYLSPHRRDTASVYASPNYNAPEQELLLPSPLDGYDMIRKELTKVKFGNFYMNPCPPSIEVADDACLDFSPETMASLPYKLQVHDLPSQSRVETQIKLKFHLSPAPPEVLLHIPQDLISKSKFCLQDPVESLPEVLKRNMLYMDTYVLTSDLKRSCAVCPRCIKREEKRALRSKTSTGDSTNNNSPTSTTPGVPKNANSWADETMTKKAIIFNCKEIVSFPAPSGLMNDRSKAFDFSARIICYCRHHKELEGFKLLFVVRDYNYNIVAKHLSSPIMIMDRKKTSSSAMKETTQGSSSHLNLSGRMGMSDDANEHESKIHPLSPNSIDDSASEALVNTDTNTESNTRGLKRKKLSFDDSYNSSTNPMFNGASAFSPVSNSDTNTSVHNLNGKGSTSLNGFAPQNYGLSIVLPRQKLQLQLAQMPQASHLPLIQKIIPAQGPIRGGIEVTLLGFNFRPGLTVKFGSKNALATHCWSESTIVTYLPPALEPGQVLVSFEEHEDLIIGTQLLIFTYTDDTDRQLIELALQIVGLKMNGKLEDAKNIAKRIVGSDGSANGSNNGTGASSPVNSPGFKEEDKEWYDNAHRAVEKLSRSDLSTEEILINFLALVDLPNCPIIIPNWQLSNGQGQSLLHLATLKNYSQLIKFLITHGCKIDIKDNQGLTPLFFASMGGYRDLIKIFLECKSNWNLKLSNDKSLKDYCDLNVLDIFNKLQAESLAAEMMSSSHGSGSETAEDGITKSHSVDSLNSLYMMDYGKHISKMVMDSAAISEERNNEPADNTDTIEELVDDFSRSKSPLTYTNESSDFADSEMDSDDNFSDDYRNFNRGLRSKDGNDEDYFDDDYDDNDSSDFEPGDEPRHKEGTSEHAAKEVNKPGLWQMMKNAVFSGDSDSELPTYDDLFPFGNGFMKPKSRLERQLNLETDVAASSPNKSYEADHHEDAGIASDSSEDMVITYINHPRKTLENDKMLLFFWLPVLVMIIGLFAYMSITGYKVELIEQFKEAGRNAIGNIMVGNERLAHVFTKDRAPLAL